MSGLQDRLDRIKAGFLDQVPDQVKAVMAGAEGELRSTGIMSRLPGPGSRLESFELVDTDGIAWNSGDLLARGPLVLTVYRGAW